MRNKIKTIAMATMLIDHIAVAFYSSIHPLIFLLMRAIGRFSIPAFTYLTIDGLNRTKSKPKYLLRILFITILSIAPHAIIMSGSIPKDFSALLEIIRAQPAPFTLSLLLISALCWHLQQLNTNNSLECLKSAYKTILIIFIAVTIKKFNIPIDGLGIALAILASNLTIDKKKDYSSNREKIFNTFAITWLYTAAMSLNGTETSLVTDEQTLMLLLSMFYSISFTIIKSLDIDSNPGNQPSRTFRTISYLFYPLHLSILVALKYIIT